MRIVIFANTSWYVFNFRMNLIRRLQKSGHEVSVISPEDAYVNRIEGSGIKHRNLSLAGSRINPFSEIITLFELHKILRKDRVDLVLSFTPKANIYAALISVPLKVKVFSNVSGLGRVFIKQSILTTVVKKMYQFSFMHSDIVYFQNEDDREYFLTESMVEDHKVRILPGSGVDIERFSPDKRKSGGNVGKPFVFLLVARVLWDKGIGEYVDAARLIKRKNPDVEFLLLGSLDSDNPSAISSEEIATWVNEGVIEYRSPTDTVEEYLAWVDCVVLPSYREGTPRSLLEAASMGIPIITTDAVGCRATVDEGVTGFLCKLRDSGDLARKMQKMIDLSAEERLRMGAKGREKMVREFDENIVIDSYLSAIEEIQQR